MNYEELVKKHLNKLVQQHPNTIQFGTGNIEDKITTLIKDQILIHCLVKVDGSPENAQKTLEKITLEAIEKNIEYPQHITAAENIFNKFQKMIKKLI